MSIIASMLEMYMVIAGVLDGILGVRWMFKWVSARGTDNIDIMITRFAYKHRETHEIIFNSVCLCNKMHDGPHS